MSLYETSKLSYGNLLFELISALHSCQKTVPVNLNPSFVIIRDTLLLRP